MSSYSFRSSRPAQYKRKHIGPGTRSNKRPTRGQYINPARFIAPATYLAEEVYVATHQFADFDVNPLIHANLMAHDYVTPTPIQDQTIALALEGKDVIGVASTGTGKTAAFAIPLLNGLISRRGSRALIVAPTRELAQQIEQECRWMAKGSGLHGALLIGGSAMTPQLRDLRANPQIVIGTPGRIKDHLERGSLSLTNFNYVVLDEVDRMLDMGFINDVRHILNQLSKQRQSFFFSATLDDKVTGLIRGFASDPVTVSLSTSLASANVEQNVVTYSANGDKLDKLHDILLKTEVSKVIVFDETQRKVERLSKELIERGFSADAIHGGKSQGQRQRALNRFKKDEINILVATDVAARGIDVADISHVINYTTPQSYDDYIHRIGRAGRAGKTGYALTFVNQ